MDYVLTFALAILTLSIAAYAQFRLRFHTAGPVQLWGSRLLLIALGAAFGWAMSTAYYPARGLMGVLVFWASFGVVHIPAAAILFIKRQRGTTR